MTDPDNARLRWVEQEAGVHDHDHDPEPDGPDTLDWEDR